MKFQEIITKRNINILPFKQFIKRALRYAMVAFSLLFVSVWIGIAGYHYFGKLGWLDSFYNASMILTGMGPIDAMTSKPAKLFASFYALYSGIVFLSTVAIFFAPFAHRLMHLLHIDRVEGEN